jgi:molybdopterin-guanine dinucleotide biosynthesis protein A
MIAGVFVGGQGRRMGGCAKGLLLAPREAGSPPTTIIERTVALARAHCDDVLLVGRADAYAALGLRAVDDDPGAVGEGPLGGLVALLECAARRPVIALACDMPYLTGELIGRLAREEPGAVALAARDHGRWSPLFARYDASRVLPVARATLRAGVRAVYAVLDACGGRELSLSAGERALLRDWDEPADVEGAS